MGSDSSGTAGATGPGGTEHVWRPGAIGPLQLPHRIVMGSMHVGLEGLDDGGAALAAFYAERAAGGAGLIVTGGSAVSRVGAGGRNYSFVNDDGEAEKLARVAEAVHAHGARVLLQLFHAGRYAYERSFGLQPVAPSAVYSAFSRAEPHALTHEEITATIADFASGARRARELGFDGVEIMGSEGYLLNQFTAPLTNRRDDEWGGDAQRRMRFPLAVAEAVRAAAGPGQAVVYRLSGADLVDGGTPHEDLLALAASLVDAGSVDALNVGIGWHEARVPTVQLLVPHGAWRPWARAVREAVDVPVIASNRINTIALADEALAAGDADFVSLARPFLADPAIVQRSRSDPARPVNLCIACNQACIDRSIFDRRVSCVVNPRAGHELEHRDRHDGPSARIAVVGGGPAGMEAARACAAAGHGVTLLEAGDALGGQFQMAARIPGKEDYGRTGAYFAAELASLGVEVRLRTRVDDAHELSAFDAVVVATGVTPRRIDLPGAELQHVVGYAELLRGELPARGTNVAIIGAGGIGVDVAHLLSHPPEPFHARYGLDGGPPRPPTPARTVTLMRRGERVGERIGPSTRWAVLAELRAAGVRTLTGIEYERIEPGAVTIRNPAGGERVRVPADVVVVCAGQESERALADQLAQDGRPHVVIGGAAAPEELDAERAFRDGLATPERLNQLIGSRA